MAIVSCPTTRDYTPACDFVQRPRYAPRGFLSSQLHIRAPSARIEVKLGACISKCTMYLALQIFISCSIANTVEFQWRQSRLTDPRVLESGDRPMATPRSAGRVGGNRGLSRRGRRTTERRRDSSRHQPKIMEDRSAGQTEAGMDIICQSLSSRSASLPFF
jgi:hypothetical protein